MLMRNMIMMTKRKSKDMKVVVCDNGNNDVDNDEEGDNNLGIESYKKYDRIRVKKLGPNGGDIDNDGGRDGDDSRKSDNISGGLEGEETVEMVTKIQSKMI